MISIDTLLCSHLQKILCQLRVFTKVAVQYDKECLWLSESFPRTVILCDPVSSCHAKAKPPKDTTRLDTISEIGCSTASKFEAIKVQRTKRLFHQPRIDNKVKSGGLPVDPRARKKFVQYCAISFFLEDRTLYSLYKSISSITCRKGFKGKQQRSCQWLMHGSYCKSNGEI